MRQTGSASRRIISWIGDPSPPRLIYYRDLLDHRCITVARSLIDAVLFSLPLTQRGVSTRHPDGIFRRERVSSSPTICAWCEKRQQQQQQQQTTRSLDASADCAEAPPRKLQILKPVSLITRVIRDTGRGVGVCESQSSRESFEKLGSSAKKQTTEEHVSLAGFHHPTLHHEQTRWHHPNSLAFDSDRRADRQWSCGRSLRREIWREVVFRLEATFPPYQLDDDCWNSLINRHRGGA